MRRDLLELGAPGLVAATLLLVAPFAAVLGLRERTAGRGRVARLVETQVASARSALMDAQLLLADDAAGALRLAQDAIDQLEGLDLLVRRAEPSIRRREMLALIERTREDPVMLGLMLVVARARVQTGDAAGAVRVLNPLLERIPRSVPALLVRSDAREKLGTPVGALNDLDRACSLQPGVAEEFRERRLRLARDVKSGLR